MPKRVKAGFIPPMLLLKTDTLPQGDSWTYQLKLDGYRAVAFKTGRKLHLRSRNNKDFSTRYPSVVRGLAKLPDATVIDGEVVAFDEEGRPSFNALQNFGSSPAPVVYYVFDLMVLGGAGISVASRLRNAARYWKKESCRSSPRPSTTPSISTHLCLC